MSSPSWLQNLRSALARGRGQRHHRRRGSLWAATHRPSLEVLEDRLTPSFGPAVNYPVAAPPVDMVVGDFNSDGKADLLTINGAQASVLLGHGDGTFAAAQTTDVGSGLNSVAAGDFNGDGRLDLVITSGTGSLLVVLNNTAAPGGPVTFQAARTFSTTFALGAVAVGDLNGDGNLDVVAASSELFVFQGDGAGNLGGARAVGWYPRSVAVGDIDGDGRLDVVTANEVSNNVSVLINGGNDAAGNVQFQPARNTDVYGSAASVALGDFDNNGKLDLAVSSNVTTGDWYYPQTDGYVNVLLGHGDGAFDPARATWVNSAGLGDLAVGDFDGDGKLDVVTTEGWVNAHVLLGNGDGAFRAVDHYSTGYEPDAVVVGNFNSDTFPEVAVANYYSGDVSVLLNDGGKATVWLLINDVTVTEGNTGTVAATFTVTLSAASTETITVAYAAGNGTATAGSDYQAASGTLTFAPGETSKTITVLVNGDRVGEPNETFFVNLSGATNATIANGPGVGTILDDEPRISIGDVTRYEGKKNQTTLFTFTVTLSAAYDQPVTMSFRTVDGTAKTSHQGYVRKTGTLTFAPGEMTKTITIVVNGDNKKEADEMFYLDLFDNSSNALFTKKRGLGTIFSDD
jgi:hypothetical protein